MLHVLFHALPFAIGFAMALFVFAVHQQLKVK
ncbi:membrane protein [Burkholderia phage BcepF1]|uniref:Membrane protein n=1 Tax=Burkholderia phage BcepF1 TaxID=2886897 RepID=A1YZU0_9CAUD|nr:membrane protein [Burkholderia phage BcepF1]ABL96767.1 membrane protein [Burkholderia phage BcepF1]